MSRTTRLAAFYLQCPHPQNNAKPFSLISRGASSEQIRSNEQGEQLKTVQNKVKAKEVRSKQGPPAVRLSKVKSRKAISYQRASNPVAFRTAFEDALRRNGKSSKSRRRKGDRRVPGRSNWVHISGTPPMSSLESVLLPLQKSFIRQASSSGIPNLDSAADETIPLSQLETENVESDDFFIRQMIIAMSPQARPNGWYVEFVNNSIANAVVRNHNGPDPLKCLWKEPAVRAISKMEVQDALSKQPEVFDDCTIRVEGCPDFVSSLHVMNLFSRYELQPRNGIQEHKPIDKHINIPRTILVHMQDASWARAALRDLQGHSLEGGILTLAQYPHQVRRKG